MRARGHYCDFDDADRRAPVGTRFPCHECGQVTIILGPGNVNMDSNWKAKRYIHWIFKHRPFDSEKVPSTWMKGTENGESFVYVRCCACGNVLKTEASHVNSDGFVMPDIMQEDPLKYHCLHCSECSFGNYPYLEGWKGAP